MLVAVLKKKNVEKSNGKPFPVSLFSTAMGERFMRKKSAFIQDLR